MSILEILSLSVSVSVSVSVCVCVCVCVCSNFQSKQRDMTFSVQMWSKMDLGLEIQKTNVALIISISIIEIICMPIFSKNGSL